MTTGTAKVIFLKCDLPNVTVVFGREQIDLEVAGVEHDVGRDVEDAKEMDH